MYTDIHKRLPEGCEAELLVESSRLRDTDSNAVAKLSLTPQFALFQRIALFQRSVKGE